MTSFDDRSDDSGAVTGGADQPASIDPAFSDLFRPEEVAPSAAVPDPVAPNAAESDAAEPEVAVPAPAVAEPSVDTGRLFRSQGVLDHDEAVLALTSDHFGRLKTLQRTDETTPVVAAVDDAEQTGDDNEGAPVLDATAAPTRGRRAINAVAVYIIVIGVTVLVGFANALMSSGDVGWPTGVALLVSSVYAALTVRRSDDTVAIIVPPVAMLVAALTAGQLFLGSAEGSLVNRAVVVFFTLADNWLWILLATVASLVIVLVRRRRS